MEEVSKLCGSKIVWNHNRQEKEIVPVMSTDALQKLNFGEAIIIRQRKNPYKARLRPFNRYGFRLPETPEPEERELSDTPVFNIEDAMKTRYVPVEEKKDLPAEQKEPEKTEASKDKSEEKGAREVINE